MISDESLYRAAVNCMAAGVMKAVARGDIGNFAQKIIEDIKRENDNVY